MSDKKITCSWSSDRKKAALLIDRSSWWSKHFRAKSVVLNLNHSGEVNGECAVLALLMLSRQSDIDTLHHLFNGIRDNLKKDPTRA